ncbi:hypothetical protein GGR63_002536 [Xanthomonas sp. 3272]|nr:hypothetical protein [Xanthomonas arboricola]
MRGTCSTPALYRRATGKPHYGWSNASIGWKLRANSSGDSVPQPVMRTWTTGRSRLVCRSPNASKRSAFVVQPTRAIALRFGAGTQRAGLAMESGISDSSRYDRPCDVTLSADPGELQWRAALVVSNANACVQASTGGRALIRSTVISTVPTVGGMLPLASGPGRRQFLQARAGLSRAARWSVRQRDLWSWSRRQQAMWHVPAAHVTVPGTATRMRRCQRPPQPQ